MNFSDPLWENLSLLLDIIPEKDASIALDEDAEVRLQHFLRRLDPLIDPVSLIFMQLAHRNQQLNLAFRNAARRTLLDSSASLNAPTRVFISDLLIAAPIRKKNKQTTLVRDILIISAIMILHEMGYNPTKGVETKSEEIPGTYVVFEYLVLRRRLEFAENADTIAKIWSRRRARFDEIALGYLVEN